MAEGGQGPDLAWWQAMLGGLGSLLMGWGIGLRRGRTRDGAPELSPELIALSRAEHSQTRSDVKLILEQMKEESVQHRADVDKMIELVREEGREQRKAAYALGEKIATWLGAIDKDVTRLLDRVSSRGGDG